ncbi:hypothetical protein [Longimicrobium sp.]|uniref:hypothetical protein n=1 Tax=Longimicrobium sp. TaxID=2029185 RepID=UPI002C2CC7C9|nr:hypothetical protein [Longimicrobium sp.]HSU12562.1 hypothetical protein [Longimicrobium sp.]
MKKLKLKMDTLAVATFTTGERAKIASRGTMRGHDEEVITQRCLTGTETYTCPTSAASCPTCTIAG